MATTDKRNRLVTIVGYIDPIDEDDHEAGAMISTENNEEYMVEINKQSRKLLDFIGEEVKVQGAVTETEDGEKRILITKFEIIDYEETYEDDTYNQADGSYERYDY
ncbi:MAG TPA: hypothetical protein HPQ03_08205 [Deltaproteobacteria bacterium]|nr:hypothetical protein [Deltaproteobacteria bacterium]